MPTNHIILTHTARNNRITHLSFSDEHEAQAMVRFMKRSPKTRAVALHYSVLAPARWPSSEAALPVTTENVWFKVWHWITDKCRISFVEPTP